MSDRDIRNLYEGVVGRVHQKKKIVRESELYGLVESDQMEMLPMRGDDEGRVTKAEIKRQAREYKDKNKDPRSITAITQAMTDGELPITPPGQTQDHRTREVLDQQDIETFNNTIDISDQIKIKNLLASAAKKNFRKLMSGYSTKKNIQQVMSMIMYSDISVGDFMNMIETAQQDPNIHLLDANFLLTARPGTYSIDQFVIPDGARTASGTGVNYKQLVIDSLEALKHLGSGGAQAGPYESALQLLSNRAIDQKGKGDIAVGNNLMELKAEGGRIGPEEYPSRNEIVNEAVESFHQAIDLHFRDYKDAVRNKMKNDITKQLKHKGTSYDVLSSTIAQVFGELNTPDTRDAILRPVANKLYKKAPQVDTIVKTFANNYDDFRSVIAGALFDMYKNEKTGEGAWNRLIGINLESADAIGIFETGAQLADAVRNGTVSSDIPNIIATGPAAARDYMWQLLINDVS